MAPASPSRTGRPIDFSIAATTHPPDAIVTVAGEMDVATSADALDIIRAALDAGCTRLLMDLDAATFVDAAAIGVFVETHNLAVQAGGSMTIVRASRRTTRLLHALSLGALLAKGPDEWAVGSPGPDRPHRPA